jgi:hypothetical protein
MQQVVSFSHAEKRHLSLLGLDFSFDLKFDEALVTHANEAGSPANSLLHDSVLLTVEKHFNASVGYPLPWPLCKFC